MNTHFALVVPSEHSRAAESSGAVTRVDGLAERLADEITTGALLPGSRLDEVSLATRFKVSRTPVREALRQLEATGLVERRPYKGAIVAAPSPRRLAEMFTAMGEIESTCARLAATAMTGPERRALLALHERMEELVRAGDPLLYAEQNVSFHEMIYGGAQNDLLATIARDLRRRLAPFRRAQFQAQGRLVRSHAEHEEIVRSIEHGEAEKAASVMRQHMTRVEAAFDAFSEGR